MSECSHRFAEGLMLAVCAEFCGAIRIYSTVLDIDTNEPDHAHDFSEGRVGTCMVDGCHSAQVRGKEEIYSPTGEMV